MSDKHKRIVSSLREYVKTMHMRPCSVTMLTDAADLIEIDERVHRGLRSHIEAQARRIAELEQSIYGCNICRGLLSDGGTAPGEARQGDG